MKQRCRRPVRPQMSGLLSLKVMLPDPSQGKLTPHFCHRMAERKFPFSLLNQLWHDDGWVPGPDGRWLLHEIKPTGGRVWTVVIDFDIDGFPVFITVCDRCERSLQEAA